MIYYTTNPDGSIKEYTDFKFSEDCIETDDDIILDYNDHYIFKSLTLTPEYQSKLKLFDEKHNLEYDVYILKKHLNDTDFIACKLAECDSEEEKQSLRLKYATQLQERKECRIQINQLEDKIKSIQNQL